jgi:hypothetical protein
MIRRRKMRGRIRGDESEIKEIRKRIKRGKKKIRLKE